MTAANRTTVDLDIPKTAEERIRRTLQPQALFRWFRPKRASDNELILQQLHYDGANNPEWITVPVVMED